MKLKRYLTTLPIIGQAQRSEQRPAAADAAAEDMENNNDGDDFLGMKRGGDEDAKSDYYSENMGTVFIDEMLAGSDLKFLTNHKAVLRAEKAAAESGAAAKIEVEGPEEERE